VLLLVPAYPGSPGTKFVVVVVYIYSYGQYSCMTLKDNAKYNSNLSRLVCINLQYLHDNNDKKAG